MEQLRACLAGLQGLSASPNEILVVDNSLGDAETKRTAEEFGARYVVEPAPGLSHARNRGLSECSTDVVAFIDDDAVPTRQWLRHLLAPFADGAVGAATGDTFSTLKTDDLQAIEPSRRVSNRDPLWFEIANFGGLGFGTNMALRRSLCRDPDFFDVRLGRGAPHWIAEESHAFSRLISNGHDVVHVPSAIVMHPDKSRNILQEAATSFAYWLLLLVEFPEHRMDLLRFFFRRIRGKELSWPREPKGPGEVIKSGWRVYIKAGVAGTILYLKARKLKPALRKMA